MHELKQLLATENRLSELRSSISGLAGDPGAASTSDVDVDGAPSTQLPIWTADEASLALLVPTLLPVDSRWC